MKHVHKAILRRAAALALPEDEIPAVIPDQSDWSRVVVASRLVDGRLLLRSRAEEAKSRAEKVKAFRDRLADPRFGAREAFK
eukprot:12488724-Alexandrium_andersonii.AAC.1